MSVNKSLSAVLLLLLIPVVLVAQNTNSPYSRNGYGSLEYPSIGKSRAMGGIGIGLRDKNMIDFTNPASYSSLDTMNMMFDFGVSGYYSRFKEGSNIQGNFNGGLDYVAMKIPLKRNWGLALGLVPFSKVGYSYSVEGSLHDYQGNDIDYTKSYAGTGGMNTVFIGTSVSLWDKLALGINYKYTFGTITQASSLISDNSEFNSKNPTEYWYLNASSLDFGIQYEQKIGKKNNFVVGAIFSAKSPVNNEVYLLDITTDTINSSFKSGFEFPRTLGVGATWTYDNRLTIGFDYHTQAWSKSLFYGSSDTLSNNTRISIGAEYLPSFLANHYYQAIKYRFGLYYTDSYMKFPEGNLKNVGLTFGIGLPLRGQKSNLNLSFEAGRILPPKTSYISENYYKISLDIIFDEFWFFKRKL